MCAGMCSDDGAEVEAAHLVRGAQVLAHFLLLHICLGDDLPQQD